MMNSQINPGEFPADKNVAKFAEQHLGLSGVFLKDCVFGQMQSAVNREGRKILAERLINLRKAVMSGYPGCVL